MSLMAYDHFSWDGAFASDWRWPAAEVLIYLVSAGCGHEGPWVLGLFSGWFFVLTVTWSWANYVKKSRFRCGPPTHGDQIPHDVFSIFL
jgi:hypothetical protein